MLSMTVETRLDSGSKSGEMSDPVLVGRRAQVWVHSHKQDIVGPVLPTNFPSSGSAFHSSMEKRHVRSTEVSFIAMVEEGWKILQDCWDGSGKKDVNRHWRSESVGQCHC